MASRALAAGASKMWVGDGGRSVGRDRCEITSVALRGIGNAVAIGVCEVDLCGIRNPVGVGVGQVRPDGIGNPLSAGAAGGDRAGQQAGAHLPPWKAAQAPSPSAQGRPLHRCRRLSGGVDPLHPAGPGQDEARWAEYGPAVADFAQRLFDGPLPWAKVRQGHKPIRMGQRYTPERLDAACRRALDVDLIDVRRVERFLVQALEEEAVPQLPLPIPAGRFARPGSVFAHARRRSRLAFLLWFFPLARAGAGRVQRFCLLIPSGVCAPG